MNEPDRYGLPAVQEKAQAVWAWAFGNGNQGAADRIRWLESEMKGIKEHLAEISKIEERREQREKAFQNQVRGGTWIIGALIALIGLLIAVLGL